MGYSMYQRHYGVPLSYDLTTFQIPGQKFSNTNKNTQKFLMSKKDPTNF